MKKMKFKQIKLFIPVEYEKKILDAVSEITGIDYNPSEKLKKAIEKGVEI